MGQLSALVQAGAARPAGTRRLQRSCACAGKEAGQGDCEACRKKRVQRSAAGAPPDAGAVDHAAFERGGQPLARAWRERLEPMFGVDFGEVRLHDDGASHTAARELRAHAFTFGQHIHFAAGQFRPAAPEGLHLLAHELTHTVQQRGSGAGVATDAVDIDAPDSALERAADAAADAVVAGRSAPPRPVAGAVGVQRRVQRQGEAEGTRTRKVDEHTTVSVTRSLIQRPCRRVEDNQATPRKDIFFWDDASQAIGLRYKICRGKVQLSSGVSIDYADVERAAKDLLRSVGSNPAGANAALQDAVNSATVSASGHVSFTLDKTLDVTLAGDSSAGAQQQQAQVKVRLLVDTASGKVQVLAEAGAGITQSDLSREVERYVKGQLKLGPVSIEVKFSDKTTTPAGGAGSSSSSTTLTGQVPIGKTGVSLGCNYTHAGPGNDSFTCGPQVALDAPAKPQKVSCYACECPPPRPDYTCRKKVEAHTKPVVDVTEGHQVERVLYQFDSDAPAQDAEFRGQVAGMAGLVGSGYRVTDILGYASPEASRAYNEKLGARRARHTHGAIRTELQARQLTTTLPEPRGVGELLGDSSARVGKEASNRELIAELRARLSGLDDEARLDLLGVDGPRRSVPAQREQVLEDIRQFIDGKDADGRKLGERALWEKLFPHLRRVEVTLHRDEKSHDEEVKESNDPSACDAADKAFIDAELGPVPEAKRLPQESCS